MARNSSVNLNKKKKSLPIFFYEIQIFITHESNDTGIAGGTICCIPFHYITSIKKKVSLSLP